MGGSSKPAELKVTPFVEPPAPRQPVPNWFQRGNPMQQPMYQPGPSQSLVGQTEVLQALIQRMMQQRNAPRRQMVAPPNEGVM